MCLLKLFCIYIHLDKNPQIHKYPIFSLRSYKIQLFIKTNISLSKELSVRLAEWIYCNIPWNLFFYAFNGGNILHLSILHRKVKCQSLSLSEIRVSPLSFSLSLLLGEILLREYLVVSSFLILLEQIFAYQSPETNKHNSMMVPSAVLILLRPSVGKRW